MCVERCKTMSTVALQYSERNAMNTHAPARRIAPIVLAMPSSLINRLKL